MAKYDFINNFRVARNLYIHAQIMADGATLDAPAKERRLLRGALWLASVSVAKFDAADFAELGLDRQMELGDAVGEFLAVAKTVPLTAFPTPEQFTKGLCAFEKIQAFLSVGVVFNDEDVVFQNVMRGFDYPDQMINWDFRFDWDSTGDPGVWVRYYIDELPTPRNLIIRQMSAWSRMLEPLLARAGISRFLYPSVRTAAEHKSLT